MCNCGEQKKDALIPQVAVITDMRKDTSDITTFRVEALGGGICFDFKPGQCAMLSVPGQGEAIFSITSAPTNQQYMEFSIKKCGTVTDCLHAMEIGQQIAIRGPYGNSFPVETELKNKELVFIAGGIGVAPLRSVINYVFAKREAYKAVDIIYGARSSQDFVHYQEIVDVWAKQKDTSVNLTVDKAEVAWTGHVGFIPDYIEQLQISATKTVIVCGPPIMIKLTLAKLQALGMDKSQIYTTLELKMKCGIGKCGRCNIGSKYVCKDGPVFRCDELEELPDEY